MAISPSQAEARAVELSRLYAQVEIQLLLRLAASLKDPSQWLQLKLGDVRRLQRQMDVMFTDTSRAARSLASELIDEAYRTGTLSAVRDLSLVIESPLVLTNEATIAAFIDEVMQPLEGARFSILRQVDDVYRRAVLEGSRGAITGVETRRQTVQSILNQFADRGVTGFTDRAGRRWGLPEYSDMAARTAMGRAAVAGHMNTLTDNGYDLVIVSDSPEECERCRPYEGRVYSLSGESRRYPPIDEAMSGGLFHPRCTHRLGAYFEGITKPMHDTANPVGYEQRQRQRQMERNVRRWKRREAVAITDDQKQAARAKVRQWQGELRRFTAANDRKRRYDREQVTL